MELQVIENKEVVLDWATLLMYQRFASLYIKKKSEGSTLSGRPFRFDAGWADDASQQALCDVLSRGSDEEYKKILDIRLFKVASLRAYFKILRGEQTAQKELTDERAAWLAAREDYDDLPIVWELILESLTSATERKVAEMLGAGAMTKEITSPSGVGCHNRVVSRVKQKLAKVFLAMGLRRALE